LSSVGLKVARLDSGARDQCALLVGNGAGNRAPEFLGRGKWEKESETG
jgi:hypothetical protein